MFLKKIKTVAKIMATKIDDAVITRLALSSGWYYGFWVSRVINNIKIIGKENIPKKGNVIYVSTHRTLIDSFLIASFICRLRDVFLRYWRIPWNTPDESNFFGNKFFRWVFNHLKNIAITRPSGKLGTRKMLGQLVIVGQKLKQGDTVLMFSSGTRVDDGQIGEFKPGIAEVIYNQKPMVIPIFLDNVQQIMPKEVGFDFIWPLFPFIVKLKLKPSFKFSIIIKKRIKGRLVIGSPIVFNGVLSKPKNSKTKKEIGQIVLQAINDLKYKTLAV